MRAGEGKSPGSRGRRSRRGARKREPRERRKSACVRVLGCGALQKECTVFSDRATGWFFKGGAARPSRWARLRARVRSLRRRVGEEEEEEESAPLSQSEQLQLVVLGYGRASPPSPRAARVILRAAACDAAATATARVAKDEAAQAALPQQATSTLALSEREILEMSDRALWLLASREADVPLRRRPFSSIHRGREKMCPLPRVLLSLSSVVARGI